MALTSQGAESIANDWWSDQITSLSLHTGPAVVGSGGNEVDTAGYRRGVFGTNPWNFNETTGAITNANLITLGTITAASPSISHYAFLDASGQILFRGAFGTAPGVLAVNTAIEFIVGSITLNVSFT